MDRFCDTAPFQTPCVKWQPHCRSNIETDQQIELISKFLTMFITRAISSTWRIPQFHRPALCLQDIPTTLHFVSMFGLCRKMTRALLFWTALRLWLQNLFSFCFSLPTEEMFLFSFVFSSQNKKSFPVASFLLTLSWTLSIIRHSLLSLYPNVITKSACNWKSNFRNGSSFCHVPQVKEKLVKSSSSCLV